MAASAVAAEPQMSVTGVSGYMIATMSAGASWFWMNSMSGLRTDMSLPRRTW